MDLFYCKIAGFGDLHGANYLTPDRRARMERYIKAEDRARCLVGGLLLRYALGGGYGEHLYFGEYGKPYVRGGADFNLSHAGEYVALAVAAHEVGVDIEHIEPYSSAVAQKCFTPEEQAWLKTKHEREFFRLWTGKESVMKACGAGFHLPPESFSILPAKDGAHTAGGRVWYLRWHSLEDHEICTACAADEAVHIKALSKALLLEEISCNDQTSGR